VLVIAPTNTGKSVGISLPTGLVWRHSYLALDLKGENWAVTSGLRQLSARSTGLRRPTADTHRYNPLTQIRRGDAEVRDAQVLADMLVDPEGALRERSHWQLRAFELLVATILWTLYAEKQKSLARVGRAAGRPGAPCARPVRRDAASPNQGWRAPSGRRRWRASAPGHGGCRALGRCLDRSRLPGALSRPCPRARDREVSDFTIEELIAGERPSRSIWLSRPKRCPASRRCCA
jgi:hypothetical protein